MIDYNSSDKIIKYLNDGNLEKLRKYVESEREKYYLKIAKEAIEKYLKDFGCYSRLNTNLNNMTNWGNLFITNGFSAYFLKDESIMTPKIARSSKQTRTDGVVDLFNNVQENSTDVEKMETISEIRFEKLASPAYDSGIMMYTSNDEIMHVFSKSEFTFTEKFLGSDIKYKLCHDKPMYIAESSRGKCIVFGIQRVPKN